MLSKLSQIEKDKNYMTSLTCGIENEATNKLVDNSVEVTGREEDKGGEGARTRGDGGRRGLGGEHADGRLRT